MATVNQHIRDHQLNFEWKYREVCSLSWIFFDAFRELYFQDVADCYFHVEPANKKSRLVYSYGINGVGAEHDCLLNDKWLGRPVFEVAAYILHALIHMWQESLGTCNTYGGHNKAFQEMAAELGIGADGKRVCKVCYCSNSFIELVGGIDPDYMRPCVAGIQDPVLTKIYRPVYDCGCRRITSATRADASCEVCGKPFLIVTENHGPRKYACGCGQIQSDRAGAIKCNTCGQTMLEVF